jgi:hypothetical protein
VVSEYATIARAMGVRPEALPGGLQALADLYREAW